MQIIHVVAGLWKYTGGPAEVIPKLCSAQVKSGCKVTLLSIEGPHSIATLECASEGVNFQAFNTGIFKFVRNSPGLNKALKEYSQNCDIIHDHGMWLYPNWCATKWAKENHKPLVISPHGVLTPGMLKRSKFKKFIAWHLFDKKSVDYASALQAFTLEEYESMKPKIHKKQIAIIPNGVDIPNLPDKFIFLNKYPELKDKKILLYLARIHPIKGIFDLINAWAQISPKYPEWHLVLVGNKESECIEKLDRMIVEYNIQATVTLTGALYGESKYEALSAANAFVLPSHAEGFPTSILEALSCGLPVVYTKPCNFPEVAKCGAGLLSDTGEDNIIPNLEKIMKMKDADRFTMGSSGIRLVHENYIWDKIAQQWLQTYKWLLNGNNKPDFVIN